MENIAKVERLNSIRNEMTHIWGAVFVVGGGALALLFDKMDITHCLLSLIGFSAAIVLGNAYLLRRSEVMKIIKDLEG